MKISCLIIDDEQLARDMLEVYANRTNKLKVSGKCKSAREAQLFLQNNSVDLLLLDIQMPIMTGINLLKQLQQPLYVIFTTAFANYALEGYDLNIIDFLLKPIGYSRFKQSIEKVEHLIETQQKAKAFDYNLSFNERFIIIKEGFNHHKIFLQDITYIEAMREYILYHTVNEKRMELKSLSKAEMDLPKSHFIRIHRSFIIAKSAIMSHKKNEVILSNGSIIPIGKTYKQKVVKSLFK